MSRAVEMVKAAFGDGIRVIGDPDLVPEQGSLIGKKNPTLDQVLEYYHQGFSVIPVEPKDKKPLVAWEQYQKERASEETLTQWFSSWPRANIGIITGEVSGLVVVDCDAKTAVRELKNLLTSIKPIPRVKTGSGWHFFFKHPGQHIKTCVGILPKMDVRGDGGYVVAPPSVHPCGKRYEWQISLNGELPGLPQAILNLLTTPRTANGQTEKRFNCSVVWEGIPEGQRDDQLFRYACQLRGLNAPQDIAEKLILEAASRCKPPLSEREALKKVQQAWKYDQGHSGEINRKPVLHRVSEMSVRNRT